MKRRMLLAAMLGCLVSGSGIAFAQDKPTDTMDILREKVRADRKLVVALALDLTESEATKFWPVYNAYQSDMIVHNDRVTKLVDKYAQAYQTMTDETATQLLDEFLAIELDRVALLTRYVPTLRTVLPPQKVARFYQIENKLQAIVSYELAREIPLIK